VRILENVPCGNGVAGCEGRKGGRGFKVGTGSGWEILDDFWDVSGASWLDVDDDVSTCVDSEWGMMLMFRVLWTSWFKGLAIKERAR